MATLPFWDGLYKNLFRQGGIHVHMISDTLPFPQNDICFTSALGHEGLITLPPYPLSSRQSRVFDKERGINVSGGHPQTPARGQIPLGSPFYSRLP